MAGSVWRRAGAESKQRMYPVRQVGHVFFGQGLRKTGHIAGIIGPLACLEVFQLSHDVLGMLTSQTWNLILSGHATEMAHCAQ